MDPRVRRHAEIIVDHSTAVRPGDDVIVRAPTAARELIIALHQIIGERGGNPAVSLVDHQAHRAYLLGANPGELELPGHVLAFVEAADVYIDVKAGRNVHETSDVPPETATAFGEATAPLWEPLMETRYVLTQFPVPGDAQKAEMSTAAYKEFVWDAIDRDWNTQREYQEELVTILDSADEIRIVSGDDTDLVMSVAGNPATNGFGRRNLPDGEVATAPIPESVEGTVSFDMPLLTRGREIRGLSLEFDAGEVVDFGADRNEELVGSLLDTDDGARRLGEIGFGMNRAIDQFTGNMLFDEKMGDTIHLALGRAYEDTVGEGNKKNESAIHEDVLVDVSRDSVVEVDGDVVQRDGTFVFEEGFEA